MALSLTVVAPFTNARPFTNSDGATFECFVDIANATNDYPNTGTFSTSGYPLSSTQLGLGEILYLDVASLSGYVAHYDYANQRLHLFQQSAATGKLTEVANNVNTAITGRVMAIGKGPMTALGLTI